MADKKISALVDGGNNISESDTTIIVQDGTTKKTSLQDMKGMFNAEQNIKIASLEDERVQTKDTTHTYVDSETDTDSDGDNDTYKMYVEDGSLTIERIS